MTVTPLLTALSEVEQALRKTWDELGWLYSNTRKIAGYPNSPSATRTVSERLHHLSGGLTIVYLFALLEEFVDPGSTMWTEFLDLLSADDSEKLMAFKHVRNTMAHGFDGTRARRHRQQFDAVMGRDREGDRIQGVATYDVDSIRLKHGVGIEAYQFISGVVAQAIHAEAGR